MLRKKPLVFCTKLKLKIEHVLVKRPTQKNIFHIQGIIDEFYNQCEKTGIDCIQILLKENLFCPFCQAVLRNNQSFAFLLINELELISDLRQSISAR